MVFGLRKLLVSVMGLPEKETQEQRETTTLNEPARLDVQDGFKSACSCVALSVCQS